MPARPRKCCGKKVRFTPVNMTPKWALAHVVCRVYPVNSAHQEETHFHTHSHTIGDLGLSILSKDTSTCGLEEPGIEPPIFQLVDDRSTF